MEGRYNYLGCKRYAQVFASNFFFAASYSIEKKILSGQVLRDFIKDFCVVDRLFCDRSKEQASKGVYFVK